MARVHSTREIRTDIINGPSQGGPGSTAAERGSVLLEVGTEPRAYRVVQERSRRLSVGLPLTAIGLHVFHGEGDQAWGREDEGRLTE